MARINVSNNTSMPIYIGSDMIPPGDSRDFDERDVPEHLKPKPTDPAPEPAPPPEQAVTDLAIAELRAKTVAAIAAELPALTTERLDALEAAEAGDDNARKTLIEAIAAERLRRAADPQ